VDDEAEVADRANAAETGGQEAESGQPSPDVDDPQPDASRPDPAAADEPVVATEAGSSLDDLMDAESPAPAKRAVSKTSAGRTGRPLGALFRGEKR
jgi:hypothetical protein